MKQKLLIAALFILGLVPARALEPISLRLPSGGVGYSNVLASKNSATTQTLQSWNIITHGVDLWDHIEGISAGATSWGAIGGTISNQTDLQAALNAKPNVTLAGENYLSISTQQITAAKIALGSNVSGILPIANGGTGAATSSGNKLLGSPADGSSGALLLRVLVDADVPAAITRDSEAAAAYAAIGHTHAWGSVTGTLSSQTDLQSALDAKVTGNVGITGATKTKVTYDSKGLVTSGADATTADIAASANKNYVTDAQAVVIGNTSGANTGDQDLSGLMVKANNLSDVVSASTSRTNLGLGTLATQSGTFSGTSSGTNTGDQDLSGLLVKSANLSDLVSASTARTNLGLGTLATQSGTFSGTSSGTNTGDVTLGGTPDYLTIAGQVITRNKLDIADDLAAFTSANIAGVVSDETGTDKIVFSNSPVFTTPNIGSATGSISGNAATVTTNANLTGPVTSSGNATTITDAAVTLAKMANIATARVLGRNTAGSGIIEELSTIPTGVVPAFTGAVTNSAGSLAFTLATNLAYSQKKFRIDAGSTVLTTGFKGDDFIEFNGTIVAYSITSTVSGSVQMDLWVDDYTNGDLSIADTIVASAPVTMTTAKQVYSTTLTAWSTTLTRLKKIGYNINSVTSLTNLTLTIFVSRTS